MYNKNMAADNSWSGTRYLFGTPFLSAFLGSSDGYFSGVEARSKYGRMRPVDEAKMTDETERDSLWADAVTKSRLDKLARYG